MGDRIVLIFGVGANVGQSLAMAFKAKGYKLALASRKLNAEDSDHEELHIQTDCANPGDVFKAFEKVKSVWGVPNVVVYNAYIHVDNSPTDIFEVSLDVLQRHTVVNLFSAYAAAQEAVRGWKSQPSSMIKPTYIYTGNCANVIPLPTIMSLSVGKTGSAAFIASAAEAYQGDGFRFYYADEREEDGTPMWNGPTGEAHAKHYLELAEAEEQLPWLQTFVDGLGYKMF